MGKISDIWVRLGLKKDGFDKGMDDAGKKAEGFGSTLGKMKVGALAVWGAIGAAVTKLAKDLIDSTNRMGDAWATFTAQSKAAWDTFLSSVSSWDFSNFFGRMREATNAAAAYAAALDSEFEANNSIRLQKAAMAAENAALKVLMADQTKTYDERIKAAKDYLANIEPIYAQIEAQAKKMADANFGKWLAGSGLGDTEQVREDLRKFIVEIGKNDELSSQLLYLVQNRERYTMSLSNLSKGNLADKARQPLVAFKAEYEAAQQWVKEYGATAGFSTSLYDMFRVYNNRRGDKGTKPLVDALVAADEAGSLYNAQTKEIQSVLSGLIKQQTAEAAKKAAEEFAKSPEGMLAQAREDIIAGLEDIDLTDIEIEPIDWDVILGDYDKPLDDLVAKWQDSQMLIQQMNDMLGNAIMTSMSNGLQAISDMMMGIEGADMKGVLAAFIAPFGDMMRNMGSLIMAYGTSMDAFKKAFTNPYAAIAAGAGLMALGSLISAGAQRIASGSMNGGGSSSYAGGASSYGQVENYQSEMTIYVKGQLSGSDIVLAGQKTINKWAR